MSYLSELEDALRSDGLASRRVAVIFRRMLAELRDRLQRFDDRVDNLNARLSPIEARLQLVDSLPSEAPLGALIRLRVGTAADRAALYLGNGAGQPLTKLVPAAV